jgi:hypothetical protein
MAFLGGLFGGGGGDDFNISDSPYMQSYGSDVANIRSRATDPITGLDVGGQAASDLASTVYGNQLDQFQRQAGSNLATGAANVGRYGGDAGSMERMQNQANRQNLIGQQGLGQTNMQNQANIGAQNIAQQQGFQNTALMALPQMSMAPAEMDLRAQAANQQANEAQQQGLFGLIGTGVGAGFGGPLGASIGGAGGQALAGLF